MYFLAVVGNAAERVSHPHSCSWFQVQLEGKMFDEPADPTNYTFTLIRVSLSGCQETEPIAQFISCLWDSFCWINDSKPVVKEAILPSAGEVTAFHEPF